MEKFAVYVCAPVWSTNKPALIVRVSLEAASSTAPSASMLTTASASAAAALASSVALLEMLLRLLACE
jgi:hypothetical protein